MLVTYDSRDNYTLFSSSDINCCVQFNDLDYTIAVST